MAEVAAIVENIDTRPIILDAPPAVDLSPNPDEYFILAAAIAGKADLIVSGDKNTCSPLAQLKASSSSARATPWND